jgi:threonine synthase
MITQEGGNLTAIGTKGNFDDAQNSVKKMFNNSIFTRLINENGYVLSSANSINWGRILPQIAYYFSAYCDLLNSGAISLGDNINIVAPTGNFGNILSAYYANKCGLPVNRLICASNQNNVLTDFINTGIYNKNRRFYNTISPSMDILVSSNLERLLFDIYNYNSDSVKSLMGMLHSEGRYEISPVALDAIQSIFYGGYADNDTTLSTINEAFTKYGYLSDTHTAVGIKVYRDYVEKTGDSTQTIITSTASPFKFAESVLKALGHASGDGFADMNKLSEISGIKIPAPLSALAGKHERHKNVCATDEMEQQLMYWLGI